MVPLADRFCLLVSIFLIQQLQNFFHQVRRGDLGHPMRLFRLADELHIRCQVIVRRHIRARFDLAGTEIAHEHHWCAGSIRQVSRPGIRRDHHPAIAQQAIQRAQPQLARQDGCIQFGLTIYPLEDAAVLLRSAQDHPRGSLLPEPLKCFPEFFQRPHARWLAARTETCDDRFAGLQSVAGPPLAGCRLILRCGIDQRSQGPVRPLTSQLRRQFPEIGRERLRVTERDGVGDQPGKTFMHIRHPVGYPQPGGQQQAGPVSAGIIADCHIGPGTQLCPDLFPQHRQVWRTRR